MRIVFMGSAELARASLEHLAAENSLETVLAVTQPDRPRGRSLKTAQCPLKESAVALGVPVFSPEKVNLPESIDVIRQAGPDLIVVVAYGQILGREILDMAPVGCVNVHASLLPSYRGAAPIQWAIVHGEDVTGVTTMHVSEKMDAGDIIYQEEEQILHEDTAGSLHDRLAATGARLLRRTIRDMVTGSAPRIPQDHNRATFAPKINKSDGLIDWKLPARELFDRIRGFNPWPVCFCLLPDGKKRIRVFHSRIEHGEGTPGTVVGLDGDGPLIQTGAGRLRLLEVQPEGKKKMPGRDFLMGHSLEAGSVCP